MRDRANAAGYIDVKVAATNGHTFDLLSVVLSRNSYEKKESVMTVAETADQLVSTAREARSWLLDLSEEAVRHKPAPDRWSIAEVIGHLVDSACNNHQRFVRAQESETLEFPKYDQISWTAKGDYHGSNWAGLIELWFQYNCHLAHVIRNIPAEQLSTPCAITSYEPCTLEFLVTDYLDHLNHHMAKIRERVE